LAKNKLLNDPKHWRDRAEEARIHAEQMRDAEACRMMLETAAGYECLAKKAEQRLLLDAPPFRYRPSDAL
jgi:hypothetical protein